MDTRRIKQEISLKEWQDRIYARQSSGQTVAVWCAANGISVHAYYYWLRKLREKTLEIQKTSSLSNLVPSFCALDLSEEPVDQMKGFAKEAGSCPKFSLKLPNLNLEMDHTVSQQEVRMALAVLKSLCF